MELKIGDRLVDETGQWEVVSRPYTSSHLDGLGKEETPWWAARRRLRLGPEHARTGTYVERLPCLYY